MPSTRDQIVPPSNHFDGKRFHNQEHSPLGGLLYLLRWKRTSRPGPWREWTDAPPGPPPPIRVGAGELRVTFINHATVLIQMEGQNILTDPIWSDRCTPLSWIGPRRRRPPGIRFEDLPPIDAVLISHNHYDHLDVPTLQRIEEAFSPRVYTGLGNRAFLESKGIGKVYDLDWWDKAALGPDLGVQAVPARHFSGRGILDRDRSLWAGFVLSGARGAVYFAGDTGYGSHFEEIRRRSGPIRLALLPIGAFQPEWFMSRIHLSPEDAIKAHAALGASTSVGIHFGTFRLGDDGQDLPIERIRAALAAHGSPKPRFWILECGEGRTVPPLDEAVVSTRDCHLLQAYPKDR